MFNVLLSCCDKLQFEAEVENLLLEVVMNHFSGWGDAAVSLDVDTRWAEMTEKEASIARSISSQGGY